MTTIMVALSFATSAQAADSDLEVVPSDRQATLALRGEIASPPSQGPSIATPTADGASTLPLPIPITCPVDEVVGTYGCRTYQPPEPEDADERELTEGDIVRAVREIGLPRLNVSIEPGDSTLVNAATNFYTDPEAFAHSITLLGFDVDLRASATQYTWVHGDGTQANTTKPGQPYPDLDVTHRYREPVDVVRPHVDVTYRVQYRVDGGPWTTLGQTLTAPGPATDLHVNEAAPVLTAP